MKLLVVSLMCCISGALSQVTSLGKCPNVTVVADFDATKFVGEWFEAARFFALPQTGGKCVTANYTALDDGNVGVVNRQVNSVTGLVATVSGEATLGAAPDQAKLTVRFPSSFNIPFPYWVVGTDYDTYAVVWSCVDLKLIHESFSWILTRERQPDSSVLEAAYSVADAQGIDKSHYSNTTQTGCT